MKSRQRQAASVSRPAPIDRRTFFSQVGDGLQGAALATLLGTDLLGADSLLAAGSRQVYDLKRQQPHFEPRATSVIQLFMNGGPSQVDLLDPKPALEKFAGQPPSRDLASEIRAVREAGGLMPSPFKFTKGGESGIEVSEVMPHLAKQVDDITVIRSMFTPHIAHESSLFVMHSGRMFPGRPSLGAWVVYGLGTENRNLPAYVVLDDPKGLPINDIQNWQAGFLPAVYQGTRVRSEGSPLLNLHPREEWPNPVVKLSRSLLRRLDRNHLSRHPDEAELEARIAGYELAARMQLAASDALDVSGESEATKEMYGLNDELTASYGKRCLMARRLVERGVRLVQIYIEGQIWDNHSALVKNLGYACGKTDKPAAALLKDLKLRGLLDRTLVVWGGEFGRLPIAQQPASGEVGRDHGPSGFSVWLAGGGIKGGAVYGATDDIGYKAAENPVSVHDLHATILHLLGMNHRQLIFEREGRSERLTDEFPARVVQDIIA